MLWSKKQLVNGLQIRRQLQTGDVDTAIGPIQNGDNGVFSGGCGFG